MATEFQKTVAEMSHAELIRLRNRIYNQRRKSDNKRLDLQLHAVQGELKDRGYTAEVRAKEKAQYKKWKESIK